MCCDIGLALGMVRGVLVGGGGGVRVACPFCIPQSFHGCYERENQKMIG